MNILDRIRQNRIAKASIGYTIGNYLLRGISFLTVPLFTRLMPTSDYGKYSVYLTYDAVLTIFMALCLHSSLKNGKYKYKEQFDCYVSSILVIPLIIMAILLMIVNALGSFLIKITELDIFILNILVVHSFSNSILTIFNSKIALNYEYKRYLKISFFNTITNVALAILLMFTLCKDEKYQGRIIGSAIPMLLIAIYIYYDSFKREKPSYNKDYWKFGVLYSLPIIPHGLSQIVLSSFDRIMIKKYVDFSATGIYSLGANLQQIVAVTTSSLDSVWGPWFYEQMEKKDYKKIRKISNYYIYLIFLILTLLVIASPEIIAIMGDVEYQNAKFVAIPLLACTFFTFLYTLPVTVEYYYQKTVMIAFGTAGAAFINIVLNYIFIRAYGYQAAAYTTITAYIIYFIFHYLIAKKIAKQQLFDTKRILLFILILVCICIFTLVFIENLLIRLIVGIIYLMVNCFILFSQSKKIRGMTKA